MAWQMFIPSMIDLGMSLFGPGSDGPPQQDFTAVYDYTGKAFDTLEDKISFLTEPGGGFAQKEAIIDQTNFIERKGIGDKFGQQMEQVHSKYSDLAGKTGIAGHGGVEKIKKDVQTNLYAAYEGQADTHAI